MTQPLPIYVPPEGDEPLDAIERALVRFFVSIIADEIRAEQHEAERIAEEMTAERQRTRAQRPAAS